MGQSNDKGSAALKVIGIGAVVILALFAINLVGGFINFGAEALHETQRVLSVKNIREQRTAIIQDWQDLLVASGNACEAVSTPPSANSPTLVESPAMAYAATARKARVDYNRRQHNLFEAEEVGPPGYPETIPDGPAMDAFKPNWCKIAADLHQVHE